MEKWAEIRRRVKVEGVSQRQILRETGVHWRTLKKILSNSAPPGYRREEGRERPKLGPYVDRIRAILEEDREAPRKQRHTAKRIFDRLREEGYPGGYTVVKDVVRELRRTSREVFMPLVHRPGEAQVDYFFALAKIAGQLRKVSIFLMALPYSDAFFLMVSPRECTETFWEGHVRAFAFFGGVPVRISYDNSRIAVRSILGVHRRRLTDGFLELASHYLFEHHFCTVRRPNEKGVVEGTGKYARLNFLVPVPVVASFEELNAYLLERCTDDLERRLRGRSGTKAELLEEDRAAFLPLPLSPLDASRKVATRSNSLSLVRFDRNDYSVPVADAHHPVTVKGYWDRVEICREGRVVARHERLWGCAEVAYEPWHYLGLLEPKPGALDHGLPLRDLALPECFGVLRRRQEAERGHQGTKDYITVLRFLERYPMARVAGAVERALAAGATSPDVVGLYLHPDPPTEAGTFLLEGRPHLRSVEIHPPVLGSYRSLLGVSHG